jgi:hypothetical protein
MSRLSGKWSKCLGKITVTKENFEKGKGEKGVSTDLILET